MQRTQAGRQRTEQHEARRLDLSGMQRFSVRIKEQLFQVQCT
jgi:hypothetical protein